MSFNLEACPPLSVDNGRIIYNDSSLTASNSIFNESYVVYTDAFARCDDGTLGQGDKICQPDGTWLGDPFLCIGDKNINITFEACVGCC